jgi:P4 family phage/plasmid primase-like protien
MNTLDTIISLFPSALAQEPDHAMTLRDFLSAVKGGRWERKITVLRDHIRRGDRVRYDHKKRELPAVTLSCHCLSRERDLTAEAKEITHSGWLQADFDLKDNPTLADELAAGAIRAALLADPYVGAVFVGPSGEGLKAVVCVDPERHKDSWFAAEAHFRDVHGLKLDRATKDPMRLCFVSYDPDLSTSDEFCRIPVLEKLPEKESWRPAVDTTIADIEEMLSFVPPRPDYDTWLRIASAVWSVLPMEDGARILHKWSPEERDGEYVGKHKGRLKQVGIGTLCHIAAQHGFDATAAWRRKRWAGRIRFADSERGPGQGEDPTQDTVPFGPMVAEVSRERIMQAFSAGQAGDARLWCEMRRGLRVWNIHAKLWMTYADGLWSRDSAHATPWDMSDLLCSLYMGIVKSIQQEMAEDSAPAGKKDPREKEIAGLAARCDKLRSWDYLAGVEKFARREMHLPATAFDINPDILVLDNGTLDFAEGVFREHRPTDHATVRSPIAFDPGADCPMWSGFLERFIPDVNTRQYLARAVGYSLTGRVHGDALFFAYGKGANGKSTFFGVLKTLLGELMTTVPIAALLAAKADNNFDYHKASMEGRRVVLTDEIPEGRSLADSQVKAITGGDPINARRPFESPYTFNPTHKLWLMGNHKPDIKGTDEGIWRRVHMIPFLVTIPENERRPRHEILMEFRREAAGILNWAIRGLLESRDIGLCPPAQVVEATQEYREESDQFGTFLIECTEKHVDAEVLVSVLAKSFSTWCEQNGETPRYRGTRQVKKVMAERGWASQTGRKDQPVILGMRLKTEEADNVLELRG